MADPAEIPGVRGNRMLAAVAALGLVAAVMAWLFLVGTVNAAKPAAGSKILLAAKDLRPGIPLRRESARVGEIPADMKELTAMSLRPEQIAAVEGAEISRFIPAGTPLLYSDLAQLRDIKLDEPWRALTVAVNEVGAMDGLLVPGDLVELYVTRQVSKPRESSAANTGGDPQTMMMQAMAQAMKADPAAEYKSTRIGDAVFEVVAVGGRLSGNRQQVLMQPEMKSSPPSSVTIKVRNDQVERILQATGAGEFPVQMVLCPKPPRKPAAE